MRELLQEALRMVRQGNVALQGPILFLADNVQSLVTFQAMFANHAELSMSILTPENEPSPGYGTAAGQTWYTRV